jgi:predicted MPP superfamily phosphohydrolase
MILRPIVATLSAALLYGSIEPWLLEVKRLEIEIENLPEAAEGMRVLQISDLHYGALMPRAMFDRIVAACQREKPDLIVLTGDIVARRESYSRFIFVRKFALPVMDYAQTVGRQLGPLRPPLGIYAVPGNHDLWNGSFEPIAQALSDEGIVSLCNRSSRLENGLAISGVDDLRAGQPDLRAAFAAVPFDEPQLILNHNPRLAMLMANRNALILSGHTHAGQIRLAGSQLRKFPVDLGNSFYLAGHYHLGNAQLYVSRGAGCVHFPFRFGARPEITVLTLRSR